MLGKQLIRCYTAENSASSDPKQGRTKLELESVSF